MTRTTVLLGALVALLALSLVSACGGETTQTAPKPATPGGTAPGGNVEAGKVVFDQHCNSCHPGGGSAAGPSLISRKSPPDRIERRVRTGGAGMPSFSTDKISDQQLQDLVAYVLSLQ